MRTKFAVVASVLLLSGICCGDCAAQQPDDAGMRNWMEYMTPGEKHKLLEGRTGKWNLALKIWMAPDQPASEMKATSEAKMIMGGRFLVEMVKGEFEGTPFEGQATTAYDNGTKKFTNTWIDNMSTGMMLGEGTYDEKKKEFHYVTRFTDPMTHKAATGRAIEKLANENSWTMQSFKVGPDGKEYMDMEITYTRVTE